MSGSRHPQLDIKIEHVAPSALIPNPRNPRAHSKRQLAKLKIVMEANGFINPVVIDEASMVLAGHARRQVAIELGMGSVPCIRLAHLSEAQKTAVSIADNKMSDESQFDTVALSKLLAELDSLDFQLEHTGFETAEIDIVLDGLAASANDPADVVFEPESSEEATSRAGEVWVLGRHRLVVGNALNLEDYERVLKGEKANCVSADAPYNVPIAGHVSGHGRVKHLNFHMASGEMSSSEYTDFLTAAMQNLCRHSVDGSIHFQFIDWRHLKEMLEAGSHCYTEQKALCVWSKTNGGMGSFYRSQHELVLVYKNGTAPHINNINLGRNGRYRTNVWVYAGANTFRAGREADLAAHPTVKPVSLIADAIRDCTKRGALILDPFIGSGTTILAAERTGRRAAGIEIEPRYVDVAIQRWQKFAGGIAVLDGDGRTFDELAQIRQPKDVDHG